MGKQQTTAKGFAILSATSLLCKILSLIYVPIQAAIVGDVGNNVISYGFRLYVFMFALSNASLPSTISKMVAEQNTLGNYKGSKRIFRVATGMLLVFGILCSIILASGAKWISNQFAQSDTYLMLLTLSPVFLFTSINCALRGYFQGTRNMVPTAVSNVIEQVFNSVFTVVFIYIFYNFSAQSQKLSHAAAGSAVGTILGAVSASVFLLFIYYITRQQRLKLERSSTYDGPQMSNYQIFRILLRYVIPAIIGAVASSAADLIDSLNSIVRMTAGGLSENIAKAINGQYTTQYQRTISITTVVATALMTALVPAVSKACAGNDRKALKRTIYSGIKALYIFMIPCLAAFTFFAKPILSLIFFNSNVCKLPELYVLHAASNQFMASWSWTYLFYGIITVQMGVLIGISKPLSGPLNLIAGMAVKLLMNILLLPVINMNGAALGSAVGWAITVVLNERAIRSRVNARTPYVRLALKPALFSVLMGIVYLPFCILEKGLGFAIHSKLLVNDIAMLITAVLGAYLYALMIVKSGTLSEAEIRRLPMGGKLAAICRRLRMFPRQEVNANLR